MIGSVDLRSQWFKEYSERDSDTDLIDPKFQVFFPENLEATWLYNQYFLTSELHIRANNFELKVLNSGPVFIFLLWISQSLWTNSYICTMKLKALNSSASQFRIEMRDKRMKMFCKIWSLISVCAFYSSPLLSSLLYPVFCSYSAENLASWLWQKYESHRKVRKKYSRLL